MSDALPILNGALAAAMGLAAFGTINKMRPGRTPLSVMGAMFLIAVGSFGSVLGAIKHEWGDYLDTALYAGVASMILVTQRVPSWVGERWAKPIAAVLTSAGLAVFFLFLFLAEARAL